MLETGEYYCYVSQPSEFKVKHICDFGEELLHLDSGINLPPKSVSIYEPESKPGTYIGISSKSKNKPKGDTYKSDGSALPVKYLGKGTRVLKNSMGGVIQETKGFIFEMYTVHLLLTIDDLVAKVHPTESVMDYTEEVAS